MQDACLPGKVSSKSCTSKVLLSRADAMYAPSHLCSASSVSGQPQKHGFEHEEARSASKPPCSCLGRKPFAAGSHQLPRAFLRSILTSKRGIPHPTQRLTAKNEAALPCRPGEGCFCYRNPSSRNQHAGKEHSHRRRFSAGQESQRELAEQ